MVVFEGWDASGKGEAIKRLVAQLETRRFEVVTTHKPTSEELAEHYLRRFWKNIPKAGLLAIFDRSWYGLRARSCRTRGSILHDGGVAEGG